MYNNSNDGYDDDLYIEPPRPYNPPVHPYTQAQEPPRAPRRSPFRVLLACLLCLCILCGVSVASIAGYVWYTGRSGLTPGGRTPITQVVYIQPTSEGALTSQEIYAKCTPWVVGISCSYQTRWGTASSSGTGIIMSEDGYILTNHHVIANASAINVTLSDGTEYAATVVGSEEKSDIGVLKIDAKSLPSAEFGQSSQLVAGDAAVVIGNPLGLAFANTMTQGIVSSVQREVEIENIIMSVIQIDAAVNPGNSGGPFINSRGQVVGVVSSKIMAEDVEGIGFAIPIDDALTIADDLIKYGKVTSRPMLGITVQTSATEPGILVTEVVSGGSADLGGVKVGDVIVAIGGVEVQTYAELNFQKDKCKVGDTVTLTVERDGNRVELSITFRAGVAS